MKWWRRFVKFLHYREQIVARQKAADLRMEASWWEQIADGHNSGADGYGEHPLGGSWS